ncbi:hypothetical protein RE6C_03156 [Rhodopirellula europaea 6C]|uniref:Uncharacterized protein n=1 Tax=Rhodopirellula europaea 6C TaxID=1263867 RepID=M2ATU8_9BACT|nr:hypothetical protein RE6C_03156 [Rhodopirellula europaea 6C]
MCYHDSTLSDPVNVLQRKNRHDRFNRTRRPRDSTIFGVHQ